MCWLKVVAFSNVVAFSKCGGIFKCGGMSRKVDVGLPEKGNSNSHGARPVHLIIMMKEWIRTSRLSIKNSLPLSAC